MWRIVWMCTKQSSQDNTAHSHYFYFARTKKLTPKLIEMHIHAHWTSRKSTFKWKPIVMTSYRCLINYGLLSLKYLKGVLSIEYFEFGFCFGLKWTKIIMAKEHVNTKLALERWTQFFLSRQYYASYCWLLHC